MSAPVRRRFALGAGVAALAMLILITRALLKAPSPDDREPKDALEGGTISRLIEQTRAANSPKELRRLLLPNPPRAAGPSSPEPKAEDALASSFNRITAAFERMSGEERTQLAEELVVDLEDAQFPALLPLLTNAAMPVEVLDVLMADALGRRESLGLTTMLEVARVPGHPKAGDALEVLQLYLETDHGSDWEAWQRALVAWLKANPDSAQGI